MIRSLLGLLKTRRRCGIMAIAKGAMGRTLPTAAPFADVSKGEVIMRSEAKKSFEHGFNLTEEELRRIHDSLIQQMERVCQDTQPISSFEVKFQNGVVANPENLEEILELENIGSAAIIRLQIKLQDRTERPNSIIKLEFVNVDSDPEPGRDAISYTIEGDNRDWVFVTSSQTEERISRIKGLALRQVLQIRGLVAPVLFVVALIAVLAVGMFFVLPSYFADMRQAEIQAIDSLEARWKEGELTDLVEVICELQRVRSKSFNASTLFQVLAGIYLVPIGLVLLFLILRGLAQFFPSYNFIWGDYVRVYEKRKATGRFILVVIILGIIVGILGNLFTALLGIR
jgi:hypothetical protein